VTDTPRPLPTGAPEQPDATIGLLLADRYRISELLARGGMARVYRARDVRLERDVAVKILSLPYAEDAAFTRRFLEEARAAASLSHLNLVHVYDSGSDGGLHYIVMELLERYRSLREVLGDRGRLLPNDVASIGRELLAGLEAVHRRGLVHCDVKAGNVMLGPGPAKLIDFGIARSPGDGGGDGSSIGSLHYMSPEQLRGERLTPASDLFALGVVLYEALTGRVPYPGEGPEEVAAAHREGAVVPPAELTADVPRRLSDAVMQALRADPAHRFGSAAAMERALASVTETVGDETETGLEAHVPPPAPDRRSYVPPVAPPAPPPRREVRAAQPPPRAGRPPRRRRSIAGSLGTLLVLGAALLVIAFVVVPLLQLGLADGGGVPEATPTPVVTTGETPPPGFVLIPDTVGLSAEEAIATASEAGLNWTLSCNHDESLEPRVYDQEPPAGTPVAPGSRFTMFYPRTDPCD
jgi:serine/threonine-protein kinase